jgi:hypothetical protein
MAEPAYAGLISALLEAVPSSATQRFDDALSTAVAAGACDAATARMLRWLQRDTVRAVHDHATTTVPAVVAALVTAAASEARREGSPGQLTAVAEAPPAGQEPPGPEGRRRSLVAGLLATPGQPG